MQLYLAATLARLQVDMEYFLRLAYIWRFNKTANTSTDAKVWEMHGIVPDYAVKYLQHLQENNHESTTVPAVSVHLTRTS